jgi:hypothetical protein
MDEQDPEKVAGAEGAPWGRNDVDTVIVPTLTP